MNIQLAPPSLTDLKPKITVIGVGGAGCNAINNMIATQLQGVEFMVANTDAQSLSMSQAERRLQLGTNLTEGLGAGARPEVGEAAAREAEDEIRAEISGSHMVFIAAGMGGGTGTGAASVIAQIAREMDILTVGIVSKPFQFEGARRMRTAEAGVNALEKVVDTLIVIPNQNLFRIANERTTFAEAFRLADQVLYSGIACIVDLIVKEGLINLDFADVQAVMKGMGTAMMGTGEATGEDRSLMAANEAIANPLLDNMTLSGAQGLLISIVGGPDLTLYEVDTAASHIRKEVAPDANIIVGATTEDGMTDRIRVSIVASGMSQAAVQADPHQGTPTQSYQPPPISKPKEAAVAATAQPSEPPSPVKLDSQDADTPGNVNAVHSAQDIKPDEADAFARALTEAMEEAGPGPEEPSWQSSEGVRIETGFVGSGPKASTPPPLPDHSQNTSPHSDDFEPSRPAEVRRGVPRMPDVSEFPEVAQREYFAKMEAAATPERRPISPTPQPHADEDEEFEKPGFLQRLTGAGRR